MQSQESFNPGYDTPYKKGGDVILAIDGDCVENENCNNEEHLVKNENTCGTEHVDTPNEVCNDKEPNECLVENEKTCGTGNVDAHNEGCNDKEQNECFVKMENACGTENVNAHSESCNDNEPNECFDEENNVTQNMKTESWMNITEAQHSGTKADHSTPKSGGKRGRWKKNWNNNANAYNNYNQSRNNIHSDNQTENTNQNEAENKNQNQSENKNQNNRTSYAGVNNQYTKNAGNKGTGNQSNRNTANANNQNKKNYNGNQNNNNGNQNNNKNVWFDAGCNGFVKEILNLFKTDIRLEPLNSWVLILHYHIASLMFFCGFVASSFGWFVKDPIVCVSSFGGEVITKEVWINICLSYPYLELSDGTRKYLLFYRWVPYSFLIVCLSFYLPKIAMDYFGKLHTKLFIANLYKVSHLYRSNTYENHQKRIIDYFKENLGTHNHTYRLFIFHHLLCVIVCSSNLWFLNFVTQGNFYTLPLQVFPLIRDAKSYRDPISLVFPPFASCFSSKASHMMNERIETFHCHLTLMEFYEKLFLVFWFALNGILLVGICSVVILVLLPFTPYSAFVLRTSSACPSMRIVKNYVIAKLAFGDLFLLSFVKRFVSEGQFCNIIEELYAIIQARLLMQEPRKVTLQSDLSDHEQYIQRIIQEYDIPTGEFSSESWRCGGHHLK